MSRRLSPVVFFISFLSLVGCGQSQQRSGNAAAVLADDEHSHSANHHDHRGRHHQGHHRPGLGNVLYSNPTGAWRFSAVDVTHWVFHDPAYVRQLEIRARAALAKAEAERRAAEATARLSDEQRRNLVHARQVLELEIRRVRAERVKAYYQARFVKLIRNEIGKIERHGLTKPTQIQALQEYLKLSQVSGADLAKMNVPALPAEQFELWGSPSHRSVKPFNPDPQGSMIGYLEFLKKNHQNVVVGSEAHVTLLNLLATADDVFAEWYEAQAKKDEMRSRRIDARFKTVEDLIAKIEGLTANPEPTTK